MSKSEGQVLDFEKICRLCLLEKRSMSAIFSKKKSDKKVPLPLRIMSCASLEIYEGDGLPASICSKCLLSVNQSFAFREQCEQADSTLRQYAQRMTEPNEGASTNREPGERIANDSLEHIEDIGNKNEEDGGGGGEHVKDLERSETLDSSRISFEYQCDSKKPCSLNSENGAMSSSGNENPEENFNKRSDGVMENSVLVSTEKNDSTVTSSNCKNENEGDESKFEGSNSNKILESPEESKNLKHSDQSRTDEVFKHSVSKKPKWEEDPDGKAIDVQDKAEVNNAVEKRFDSPVLRALSSEKAENVVVIADVDTINAKFPSDLEDEDGDLGEGGLTSSEDDESTSKIRQNKWCRRDFKTKKDSQSFKLGKMDYSKKKSPIKNSFGNQKHLELLQNLMKNKNIIVQKRVASNSNEFLAYKNLNAKYSEFTKNLRRKRDASFPYDFKIAQLWKEWEEVNKRIPQVSQKVSQPKVEAESVPKTDISTTGVPAGSDECQDDGSCSKKKGTSPEIVFEENSDQNKSDEDGKMKWKNRKDTVYCKDCRIFLLRSSYNNHIKFVHEKVRKYLCQTCGYAACTGTILRQHVQAVHVGYSFFCDQCPKKFNLMKRLRKHIELQHSGKPVERNHICQYCGMAFVKPGCLKRHLRSHTQETPYQCQYCQRRFKYRWPKVQHERLHTGEKPYKCSFCEERFTQNCVRKAHEYKKHGNEEFKPKNRTRKDENSTTSALKAEKGDSEASSRESCHSGSESS